jgi:hypothetical protein
MHGIFDKDVKMINENKEENITTSEEPLIIEDKNAEECIPMQTISQKVEISEEISSARNIPRPTGTL